MDNYFSVKFTARLKDTVRTVMTADGNKIAVFTVTPPDEINGAQKVHCIVSNTRAELLERFTSRGDLITAEGHITSVDLLLDSGDRIKESNIIEITDIESSENYTNEEETA